MAVELAPQFRDRAYKQLERERLARRRGERKIFSLGSYNQAEDNVISGYHPIREVSTRRSGLVTLSGYEVFLYDTAQQLLKSKPDSPVIIFDVGGGAGNTFSRLAMTMQQEVEDSRIAFVVSNLMATPEEQIGTHRLMRLRGNSPVRYDLNRISSELDAARDSIHFINGRFGNLHRQTITLPNRTQVDLNGNVDFLNEKYSVSTHSYIPESDITRMAGMLSPYGIYSVNQGSMVDDTITDFFIPQRRQGIEHAHRAIQTDFGLRRVTTIEAGRFEGKTLANHQIFKAPQAPLIVVQ